MDCSDVTIGMRYFACFNELSPLPLCNTEDEVEQRVRNFLLMLNEVRNHTGITKVRHSDIDIVLWWEDNGYSMRVKTTGRNASETMEIARLLKEKFGRG